MTAQRNLFLRFGALLLVLALCFVVLHVTFGRPRSENGEAPYAADRAPGLVIRAQVEAWRKQVGPDKALGMPGVQKAPLPTMDIAQLLPGEALQHTDARGSVFRFRISPDVTVNLYHSVAGSKRSGDLHNCTQYNVILQGVARLTTMDLATGVETSRTYAAFDYIITPPRTPHLYEFLEDNALLEWWDCPFEAWYFQPYRDRIVTG